MGVRTRSLEHIQKCRDSGNEGWELSTGQQTEGGRRVQGIFRKDGNRKWHTETLRGCKESLINAQHLLQLERDQQSPFHLRIQ